MRHLIVLQIAWALTIALDAPTHAAITEARAATLTLARLSFWVAPDQRETLVAFCSDQIVPFLATRDLKLATRTFESPADSIYSLLFDAATPDSFDAINKRLLADPAWQEQLHNLEIKIGVAADSLRYRLSLFEATAGQGKTVTAGPGFRQGLWQGLSARDGLPESSVMAVLQDRDRYLWFGGDGLSRFDGQTLINYSPADGVPYQTVLSILEDRNGALWLSAGQYFSRDGSGIARYDGQTFRHFTTEDGMTHNMVSDILEDHNGQLWFATDNGVSRYDGQTFINYGTADGLPHHFARDIFADRRGTLWFATNGGIGRYDESTESFTALTSKDGLANDETWSIAEDRDGNLWFATDDGASRYNGQTFTNYTTDDGLPHNEITTVLVDRSNHIWFGTFREGVSRYDGQRFENFGRQDGLLSNSIKALYEDRDGQIWVGSFGGGVNRYSGAQFNNFTSADGLVDDHVMYLMEDSKGILWFGTWGGVSRYDGVKFTTFPLFDSQVYNTWCIAEDAQENIWFGTWNGGVYRYDAVVGMGASSDDPTPHIRQFTSADGLPNNKVISIVANDDGTMWFGTWGDGISHCDGEEFTNLTKKDGLVDNYVYGMLQDRRGVLWPGTVPYINGQFVVQDGLTPTMTTSFFEDRDGVLWFTTGSDGIIRYADGQQTRLTTDHGLASNQLWSVIQDREGHMWFGHFGDGITRYDGLVMQQLSRTDGLVSDVVQEVRQDRHGDIWIATEGGITRYHPSRTPPQIRITGLIADLRYGPVATLEQSSDQELVLFQFQGSSLTTLPDQMAYVYRLVGYNGQWQATREPQIEYQHLPSGQYTFEVKAVDRDLNYSTAAATVQLTVHPPYGMLALLGSLGIALLGLLAVSVYAIRKSRDQRRAEQALMRELEDELQIAHEMQMALMPTSPPHIKGLDIAGRCLTANHVGGDLFQYFQQQDAVAIGLADVTGHAMEAAVPVVMFSGVLHAEMQYQPALATLFANLNRNLHTALASRTFVCFSMLSLDLASRIGLLANGGCPYPYHYRAANGAITEIQVDAYPLGVRAESQYEAISVQLEPGDRIILCSDGLIEAANPQEELFGFERTAATLRAGCSAQLDAGELIDKLFAEVAEFTNNAPPEDDMTCVVLRII